ncbi:hypothetical protein GCM10020369_26870 [Cryptosporangium minutisporangium]|uniref:Uncharacterized protein n=1 Tax=Cryptosporangium minutisporangium TaxID=113569 RepID=A0ABP6SXI5_9ACTN
MLLSRPWAVGAHPDNATPPVSVLRSSRQLKRRQARAVVFTTDLEPAQGGLAVEREAAANH